MNSISIGNKINVLIESHDLNEYNERMEDLMWSDEIVNKIPTEQCTVFQVYLLSVILGIDFWLYGFGLLYSLFKGHGWTISSSKYFPSKYKTI